TASTAQCGRALHATPRPLLSAASPSRDGAPEPAARLAPIQSGAEPKMHVEPGWLSLLPPIVAIVLALAFREVVLSLFAGVWFGALIVANWNPLVASMISVDRFIVEGLADTDKISIVVFSMLLGGMVGVIGRSGGTLGLVESMRNFATSAQRGQVMGWLAGIVIFFDDYANTLIVGNTMRPVTDRLSISREKLAYIVDSTAAPIA